MRYVISALMVGAVIGTARAQVAVETANLPIPGYYDALKGIVDNQIVGHRTIVERKQWDRPDDAQTLILDERRVAVHGKSLWVLRVDFPPSRMRGSGDGKDYDIHILSPDVRYYLQRKPSGGYRVNVHGTEWSDHQGYRNTVAQFAATVQLFQPWQVKEVLETADDEYEGRPTMRITLRTRDGARWNAHVDRKTYQHLYSESDKVLDLKRRGNVAGKTVAKTEYHAEGGRLWPTRHETYQVPSGGKKQPLTEITFVEYAPHTPTADELDLEKQFGIKPIPHEPRPESAKPKPLPSAARSRVWLYAAAGVLAAAAVLVAVVRYRRPAAAT